MGVKRRGVNTYLIDKEFLIKQLEWERSEGAGRGGGGGVVRNSGYGASAPPLLQEAEIRQHLKMIADKLHQLTGSHILNDERLTLRESLLRSLENVENIRKKIRAMQQIESKTWQAWEHANRFYSNGGAARRLPSAAQNHGGPRSPSPCTPTVRRGLLASSMTSAYEDLHDVRVLTIPQNLVEMHDEQRRSLSAGSSAAGGAARAGHHRPRRAREIPWSARAVQGDVNDRLSRNISIASARSTTYMEGGSWSCAAGGQDPLVRREPGTPRSIVNSPKKVGQESRQLFSRIEKTRTSKVLGPIFGAAAGDTENASGGYPFPRRGGSTAVVVDHGGRRPIFAERRPTTSTVARPIGILSGRRSMSAYVPEDSPSAHDHAHFFEKRVTTSSPASTPTDLEDRTEDRTSSPIGHEDVPFPPPCTEAVLFRSESARSSLPDENRERARSRSRSYARAGSIAAGGTTPGASDHFNVFQPINHPNFPGDARRSFEFDRQAAFGGRIGTAAAAMAGSVIPPREENDAGEGRQQERLGENHGRPGVVYNAIGTARSRSREKRQSFIVKNYLSNIHSHRREVEREVETSMLSAQPAVYTEGDSPGKLIRLEPPVSTSFHVVGAMVRESSDEDHSSARNRATGTERINIAPNEGARSSYDGHEDDYGTGSRGAIGGGWGKGMAVEHDEDVVSCISRYDEDHCGESTTPHELSLHDFSHNSADRDTSAMPSAYNDGSIGLNESVVDPNSPGEKIPPCRAGAGKPQFKPKKRSVIFSWNKGAPFKGGTGSCSEVDPHQLLNTTTSTFGGRAASARPPVARRTRPAPRADRTTRFDDEIEEVVESHDDKPRRSVVEVNTSTSLRPPAETMGLKKLRGESLFLREDDSDEEKSAKTDSDEERLFKKFTMVVPRGPSVAGKFLGKNSCPGSEEDQSLDSTRRRSVATDRSTAAPAKPKARAATKCPLVVPKGGVAARQRFLPVTPSSSPASEKSEKSLKSQESLPRIRRSLMMMNGGGPSSAQKPSAPPAQKHHHVGQTRPEKKNVQAKGSFCSPSTSNSTRSSRNLSVDCHTTAKFPSKTMSTVTASTAAPNDATKTVKGRGPPPHRRPRQSGGGRKEIFGSPAGSEESAQSFVRGFKNYAPGGGSFLSQWNTGVADLDIRGEEEDE